MDKIGVQNLLRELKATLKQIGISQRSFAERYVIEVNDFVDDETINRTRDKIIKQLNRVTTSPELINTYLHFIKSTDEYAIAPPLKSDDLYKPLTGSISDYAVIVRETSDKIERTVMEVAAAYAFAVGTAWHFEVVQIKDEDFCKRYLVLWEGDIGLCCGSGSWGTAMCEVQESHFGPHYVDKAEHRFETSLRCVSRIEGFHNGLLTLVGYSYGEEDTNNHPSQIYKVTMSKDSRDIWQVRDRQYLGLRKAYTD